MSNPYLAANIGFGLQGRFFKIEMVPKNGQAIYAKVGGCEFESEAREFAAASFQEKISLGGGLQSIRSRECGQFEAVLQ